MRSVTSPGNSKGSSRPWWAAAVVLLLIGAGFLAVGIAASGSPLAAMPTARNPAPMSSSTTAAAHQGLELPLLFPGEVTDLIHTRPIRAGRSSPTASTDGRDHRRTAKEQGQNAQANQRAGIGLRRTTSTRGRDAGRNDPGSRRGNCRVDSCDHNVDRRREPGSGSQGTDALGPGDNYSLLGDQGEALAELAAGIDNGSHLQVDEANLHVLARLEAGTAELDGRPGCGRPIAHRGRRRGAVAAVAGPAKT